MERLNAEREFVGSISGAGQYSGLKITEKYTPCKTDRPSRESDDHIKIVSPISSFVLYIYIDTQRKCNVFFFKKSILPCHLGGAIS